MFLDGVRLINNRNFLEGNVVLFMNRINSIDIDDQIDLNIANMIFNEDS